MPNPTVIRQNMRMEPMYTLGRLTGITMHLSYLCNGQTLTTTATWQLPEEDHMYAEEFEANKATIGPVLVARAAEATNIEYMAIQQINDFTATLTA